MFLCGIKIAAFIVNIGQMKENLRILRRQLKALAQCIFCPIEFPQFDVTGSSIHIGNTGSLIHRVLEGAFEISDGLPGFSGLIILLLAVGVYYLVPIEMLRTGVETLKEFVQRGNNSTETVDAPNSENGIDSAVNNVLPATAQPQEEPDPTPPEQSSPVSSAPGTASVATALPVSSATRSLILSFSEPSWVEVRDRTGQVVFSQLNPPGSRPEITGEPPFALVIGNASHVTLQYEGEAVDLSKRSKDDVARLTLE